MPADGVDHIGYPVRDLSPPARIQRGLPRLPHECSRAPKADCRESSPRTGRHARVGAFHNNGRQRCASGSLSRLRSAAHGIAAHGIAAPTQLPPLMRSAAGWSTAQGHQRHLRPHRSRRVRPNGAPSPCRCQSICRGQIEPGNHLSLRTGSEVLFVASLSAKVIAAPSAGRRDLLFRAELKNLQRMGNEPSRIWALADE